MHRLPHCQLMLPTTTAAPAWVKASRCTASTCVEVRRQEETVDLRDSKQNDAGVGQELISVSPATFDRFLDEVAGTALEGSNGEIVIDRLAGGWVAFRSLRTGVTLRYDADELQAFVAGVQAGEFRAVPALA
jgi:hypothetical protein